MVLWFDKSEVKGQYQTISLFGNQQLAYSRRGGVEFMQA